MNQAQALHYLTVMMTGLQKYRSNAMEEFGFVEGDLMWRTYAMTWPWVFGVKSAQLMSALTAVLDRGRVAPMEFYNFMTILHTFMPEVLWYIETAQALHNGEPGFHFPELTANLAKEPIPNE